MDARSLLSVAGGGVAGAALRWATFEGLDHDIAALVAVNAVGAFLLGSLVRQHRATPSRPRVWLGVGFCGALTTFSTVSMEVALRLDDGHVADAVGTVLLTTTSGLVAIWAGHRLTPGPTR